ncbi:MAG: hypothetical protein K0R46_1565 [Herbinix sp.]|jgi:DNA-binding transcriptional LysR family regulator|nr:hypothetical protein [Herbinix sp.]
MTSQQIEYLLTLAEERSFSKASQKLYVTQPSLSQFVKNLENELHTQLFDRSTSPIRLTPSGEAYVKAARKIKAIEEELNNQIADLTNLQSGQLNIGTSPFRASCLLPKSIAEFHKRYPGIELHIIENQMTDLEVATLEGVLDLYLGTGPFDETLFHAEALAEEQLYLAVPPENPINEELTGYQITIQDIKLDTAKLHKTPALNLSIFKEEQFIFQQQGQKLYTQAITLCEDANFDPQVILYSERLETAFSWSLAGIGLTFLPDFLIRFGNYERHPIYYKLNHPIATRQLCIVYKKNRYLSKAAIEYTNLLKQLIGYGTWEYKV